MTIILEEPELAGRGARLLARIIDNVLMLGTFLVPTLIIVALGGDPRRCERDDPLRTRSIRVLHALPYPPDESVRLELEAPGHLEVNIG